MACALLAPTPASAQEAEGLLTIFGGAFEGLPALGAQAELAVGGPIRPTLDVLFLSDRSGFGLLTVNGLWGLPRNREQVTRGYVGLGGGLLIVQGGGGGGAGSARAGVEFPLGAERAGLRVEARLYGARGASRPFYGIVVGIRVP